MGELIKEQQRPQQLPEGVRLDSPDVHAVIIAGEMTKKREVR